MEKVRERMYGQFGGMQQSMQKMSQDIKVTRQVEGCRAAFERNETKMDQL